VTADPIIIEGFQCFAPAVALAAVDYPEHGFEVTRAVEERSFWCRARRRLALQLFDRFVPAGRQAAALEIGCGTGFILDALRQRHDLALTGSEVYIAALRYARLRLPDVNLIQLDATTIPFASSYEAVAAFDVLEHIDDDVAAVAGVWRALKPGGVFICSVPQYQWMWSRLDELVCHKRRYSRSLLHERLEQAGFEIMFCTSFVTTLFPLMAAARLVAKARHAPEEQEGRQLEQEVNFSPIVNWLFDVVMRVDELLIRLGVRLPFGGSLVAVGRKPLPSR
jgi:SAM-dependent methyltransferase